jgi:hypothetical protein
MLEDDDHVLISKHSEYRKRAIRLNRKSTELSFIANRLVCTEQSSRLLARISAYRTKTEKARVN